MQKSLPQDRSATGRIRRGEQAHLPEKANRPVPSAIFPWIAGDEQAALRLSRSLYEQGFFVPAIRYPTVAKGTARLRITLTAAHEDAQIEALGEALRRLSTEK